MRQDDSVKRQDRRIYNKKRKKRRKTAAGTAAALIVLVVFAGMAAAGGIIFWNNSGNYTLTYEKEVYNKNVCQGELFASDLCVASGEVSLEGFQADTSIHAAGLFDLSGDNVVCGYKLFDRLYPASTTKTLTAYIALKYGNPDDEVTVSEHATDFNWDESTCGLITGDKLTLYDLICGLMLQSGNDCATAIAEYISGSEEDFVQLMNKEASALGATGTHFVNPHGLHDNDHYTTAYDLYLIFNACLKNETFVDIISMDYYTASITGTDGTVRALQWNPTNYYSTGEAVPPEGIQVFGGKTGTTDQAGNCVILYEENSAADPYISVIMGAEDKSGLYRQMNELLEAGIS